MARHLRGPAPQGNGAPRLRPHLQGGARGAFRSMGRSCAARLDRGASGEARMDDEVALRARLAALRTEHRTLDDQIAALSEASLANQLEVRRLKKRKLALRDEIARLEDEIFPDIIA